MPKPKHHETLVKKMVVVAERQWDALDAEVKGGGAKSVSELVRVALDRWLGYESLTIDPRANEQERVA